MPGTYEVLVLQAAAQVPAGPVDVGDAVGLLVVGGVVVGGVVGADVLVGLAVGVAGLVGGGVVAYGFAMIVIVRSWTPQPFA